MLVHLDYSMHTCWVHEQRGKHLVGGDLDNNVGQFGVRDALDVELQGQHVLELAGAAFHCEGAAICHVAAEAGATIETLCRTRERGSRSGACNCCVIGMKFFSYQ